MTPTLYQPGHPPRLLPPDGFALPDAAGRAPLLPAVAEALGCGPDQVDVLATGPDYVAYGVFASRDARNEEAVPVLFQLTGRVFGFDGDDEPLRGNVLVVRHPGD